MYERLEAGINESYKRDFFDEESKIDFYKKEMDNLWNWAIILLFLGMGIFRNLIMNLKFHFN